MSGSNETPKAQGNNTYTLAEHYIQQILTGKLKPGDKLPSEGKIGAEYGVSRTVVREAIKQLQAKGLVHTISGSGSYVSTGEIENFGISLQHFASTTDSLRDWLELLDLRRLIEVDCIRLLTAPGSKFDLSPIKEQLDIQRDSFDNLDQFAYADIAFHKALVLVSGHRLYSALQTAIFPAAVNFSQMTYNARALAEENYGHHKAVYDAIVEGDADRAIDALRGHLDHSKGHAAKYKPEKQ